MSQHIEISAVIITFNEEKNIARCLHSVSEVADEIVVVDSFSTDRTEEICQQTKVRWIQNEFEGHIQQKNYAMQQAKHDIVLSLDADEALSEEAIAHLKQVKEHWQADAYFINRLTNYCGQWIHHCGWYPDRKIRLWDRRKGRWGGVNPHDSVIMQHHATTQRMQGNLLHYSFPTLSSHAQTANHFSEIAAQEAFSRGKRVHWFVHILCNPFFTFLKKYFFQRGFMDGYYGFVICILSAHSNFLKYTKLYELQKNAQTHSD